MIAGAAVAIGATLPVEAAEEKPYRVRGTLESVEGHKLTVDTREGETLDLSLTDDTRVMVVRPASLDDIKQGDYVGLTSIDSGGKRVQSARTSSPTTCAAPLRATCRGT
jgi:hypothetical protein